MAGYMWMATREKGGWVPAASAGADFSSVGWSSSSQYLNGGAYVRRSSGSHKEYSLSWPLMARDELRKIDDIAKGLWGSGLIYFLDPFAMDKNVLPSHWASPMLSAEDSPPLVGEDPPTVTSTVSNVLDYPYRTAAYAGLSADADTLFVPIPRGYTAWIGVHGPSSGGRMIARGATSATNVTSDTLLPNLSVTSDSRFSHSYSGDTYMGVELTLQGNATYTGAMLQILPTGTTPLPGGFISGQGNSGCRFDGHPRTEAYSSALDKVGMTATLIEVGSWL